MASTTPTTNDSNGSTPCRLYILTIISLALNGVILLALALGFIFHHHHKHQHHHGFGGGDKGKGHFCMAGGRGFGHGFHHHHGGFGGGPGMMDGGFGMKHEGMRGGGHEEGMMGGPGMRHHGFGGGMGMMGGERGNGAAPDPAKMTDMMINHLSAKLTLTDDEKAKIKPIIQDQVTQMQKDMEAARAAHEKAMEDTKAKIKALLTPDQQKLLDSMPTPGQKPADTAAKPAGQ